MYNPDDIDLLQEIQSSDSDEDVSTSARSRSQPHDIKELVSHVKFEVDLIKILSVSCLI